MTHSRTRKLGGMFAAIAAAGLLAGPTMVHAQEAPPPVNAGAISFNAGFDIATQYWFRGLAQENQGFIIQPYLDMNVNLFSRDDGMLNSLDAYIGTWNSLHTGPSGTGGGGTLHYELDFYTGVAATVGPVGIDLGYIAYTSPNGAFGTTDEIALTLSYDDTGLLMEDFALNPYTTFAFEVGGGADAGTKQGVYMELGIAPDFILVQSEDYPISLSIPVALGLSLDKDYYESTNRSDTFGYVQIGAVFSVPLSFIPAEFGSWQASAGVHLIHLGKAAREIAGTDFGVTGGKDVEVFGTFGISMSY